MSIMLLPLIFNALIAIDSHLELFPLMPKENFSSIDLPLQPLTQLIAVESTVSPDLKEMNNYTEAFNKLKAINQTHLLSDWQALSPEQQEALLADIAALNTEKFISQQKTLQKHLQAFKIDSCSYEPFENYSYIGSLAAKDLGLQLIKAGKVGCLVVAGGQGTRLGFNGPKGSFLLSPIKNKSLFQLLAEKVIAAGEQAGVLLPIAIMTSEQNHDSTVSFFKRHSYFGLKLEQISFFTQEDLPFLDHNGQLILSNQGTISKGPDGNGSSLSAFVSSSLHEKWQHNGIEYVNFILIDNPLSDPFDQELVGVHAYNACDMTIKCIERIDPNESVGVIVSKDKSPLVVEYSEMDPKEYTATLEDGTLKHKCANISLFCFNMAFIKEAVHKQALGWHLAYKDTGSGNSKGFKFETFIFDFMASAKKLQALLYPRSSCFAPLKSKENLKAVQQALIERDKAILQAIGGKEISFLGPIELDQQFHYPTKELLERFKNQKGPFEGYITP